MSGRLRPFFLSKSRGFALIGVVGKWAVIRDRAAGAPVTQPRPRRTCSVIFVQASQYRLRNGQVRPTFALLHSRRIGGESTQRILLNLAQTFSISKQDWPEFANQVAARRRGQTCILLTDFDEHFQNAVDDIVKRLLDQGFDIHARPPDPRDTILTDKVEHLDARTVGDQRLALEALELLGMEDLLRELH